MCEEYKTLTVKLSGSNVIVSDAIIRTLDNKTAVGVRALWDTGATSSAISKRAAEALKLPLLGSTERSSVTGTSDRGLYIANIQLGDIYVNNLYVHDFVSEEFDLLVGMDVINLGDIALTGRGEERTFSFIIPSSGGVIDFHERLKEWQEKRIKRLQ